MAVSVSEKSPAIRPLEQIVLNIPAMTCALDALSCEPMYISSGTSGYDLPKNSVFLKRSACLVNAALPAIRDGDCIAKVIAYPLSLMAVMILVVGTKL